MAVRDSKARELADQREAETAERARIRAKKIAAGLLGVCSKCEREAHTAEGIVLSRQRLLPFDRRDCEGTCEEMLLVEARLR